MRPKHVSVSEKADIFTTGLVMIDLLSPYKVTPDESITFENKEAELPKRDEEAVKRYPKALTDLAYACLPIAPDD